MNFTLSFYLVSAFAIWGFLHTFTASLPFKQRITAKLGAEWSDRYYRLGYNLFAVISFLPALAIMAMDHAKPIYQFTPVWAMFATVIQLLMLMLMAYSVMQTGAMRFLGFARQNSNGQPQDFVQDGLYKWVRHPIYTASLVLLWVTPSITPLRSLFSVLATLYIFIGIIFEERKLVREFGEQYTAYQAHTPMLIPFTKK